MLRSIRACLSTFVFCTTTVCAAAVVSAADGNAAASSRDGRKRTTAGSQWTIVATYAIPEGASGLAWDGTNLYCGIYGSNGGQVYEIDPDTGSYSLLFTGPQGDAFGLTYDGQYLWTTDHPGGSAVPAIAMKLDWNGTVLEQIDLPAHYMSGIAYDNGDFWVARYYSDPSHLFKVDAAGTVLDDFVAPDNQPWDLCMAEGYLWMADYWGDALYKIDPATGNMLESHASEGVDPAGIVWDGQYLWYCDNGEGGNDFLYKVDLAGGGTAEINIPVTSHSFGPIPIGEFATWDVAVNNNGTATLEITDVTFSPMDGLSCSCAFPINIPIGGSAQLSIVYAPGDFGPLDATATIFSNDPVHPEEALTLIGDGVYPGPAIHLPQSTHNYGSVRASAHTRWFMEIRNHGSELLTIDNITIDGADFYLDSGVALPINVSTLGSVDVGVWFNPVSAAFYSATVSIFSNDPAKGPAEVALSGMGIEQEYPIGDSLWSYLIDIDFDNSVKAIAAIQDVNGDCVADVIVCSEDDYIRCFNGNAHGTGDVLWEHEIFSGSVYSQKGVQIINDIDDDGHEDVVVAATGGARLIRALSGRTGQEIWTHDTHEYGSGGWVYQVDSSHDYNDDGVDDVLACAGDDSTDTGPKRVYCLNGLTGVSLWETPLGGPGFAVIGVEDFTGDGKPDVVAGASNEMETQGRVYGINGASGSIEWTFITSGSSVWALQQVDDFTSDGVRDVIIGDFSGNFHGLDATDGSSEYSGGGFGLTTRLERLDDLNGDGHPDVIPAHLGTTARAIDGHTGAIIWSATLADKPASVARIPDINGDGVNDVVIGTLFSNNFAYFLDGTDGSVLDSINYGSAVDAIAAIPDIVGDGSWEMVVGGRNGLVRVYSGGTAVNYDPADLDQNGQVGAFDLALLLGSWGPCLDECDCPADLDGNGMVGAFDLAILLGSWGP
ncbi:MAG: choice-of-anchor D domain-containing protein [Planctomycetes bacterium]|nr:choice-of-anchor D domain-containing protein [Planctomycetota bacterium]